MPEAEADEPEPAAAGGSRPRGRGYSGVLASQGRGGGGVGVCVSGGHCGAHGKGAQRPTGGGGGGRAHGKQEAAARWSSGLPCLVRSRDDQRWFRQSRHEKRTCQVATKTETGASARAANPAGQHASTTILALAVAGRCTCILACHFCVVRVCKHNYVRVQNFVRKLPYVLLALHLRQLHVALDPRCEGTFEGWLE